MRLNIARDIAALDGSGSTVGVEEASIVQAMVISPIFGLEALDPASILGVKRIDEARANLEAAAQPNAEGIPPFSAASSPAFR
ncbi:hypothetical protein AAIB41_11540 [Brucella sp. BE17]|uniref:hypothetical protein n=1 Tax=Brucella sp. BE17 TaxID=3142977 RepID=UPI0031BB62AE